MSALVAPALVELMRSCERVSLAGAAASMLGEGVFKLGWGKEREPGGFLEEMLREACDTAEALAGPSGIDPGARARGTSPSPNPIPSLTGVTGVTSPRTKAARGKSPRASADWTDRRSQRSPGSPVGSSREPATPSAPSSAPRRHLVGTPAERATARDAVDSLLFATARSRPASFAKFLSRRIETAPPTSSSHVVALASLARAVRESPDALHVLAPHVPCVMNAVLAALTPANAALRRNCLVAATSVVAELARALPNVTYHRATARLAVGIAPAPAGGTVAIVYDLAVAATWRALVDRDDHPAEEARRLIDGFGAGFGAWAAGLGTTHPRSPSDKQPKSDEPATDSSASTWTDGWTNTLASYAGSGTAESPQSRRTSRDGWWTPFGGGRGRRGGRRSSGGGGDGGGVGGGAFASVTGVTGVTPSVTGVTSPGARGESARRDGGDTGARDARAAVRRRRRRRRDGDDRERRPDDAYIVRVA